MTMHDFFHCSEEYSEKFKSYVYSILEVNKLMKRQVICLFFVVALSTVFEVYIAF